MTPAATTVSVPGKLILMGEHSAVYRRPALVAAVAPRFRIELAGAREGVEIELPDLGHRSAASWPAILEHARAARRAWRRYAEEPGPERFAEVRGGDPAHLVKVALGEVVDKMGDPPAPEELPTLRLSASSPLPIGSGFGSSAALAVGVVAALLDFLGRPLDRELIDRIALAVERRQHGMPSGVDHRTVLHGGLLWARRQAGGELDSESLPAGSDLLARLQVWHTGRPAEGTGEVIAGVRRLRERDRGRFEQLLDRMEEGVHALRALLAEARGDEAKTCELIRGFQACLEELGVVPEPVARAVRRIEELGGAAKVSGAGALTGSAAGCLLILPPPAGDDAAEGGAALGPLSAWRPPAGWRRHAVELGAPGLRLESGS